MLKKILASLALMFGLAAPALAIDAACTQTTNLSIYRCPENSIDWYDSYTGTIDALDRLAKTAISSFTVSGNAFSVGTSTLVVANGRVGYGTTTPAAKFHLSSGTLLVDGNVSAITINGTTNPQPLTLGLEGISNGAINSPTALYFNIDSDNTVSATEAFIFARDRAGVSSGTELMRISEEGVMTLSKTDAFGAVVIAPGTATNAAGLKLTNTGGDAYLFADNSGGDYSGLAAAGAYDTFLLSGAGESLHLGAGAAGAATELTILPTSGNVGIGTTDPVTKLDVNGVVTVGSMTTNGYIRAGSGSNSLPELSFSGDTNSGIRNHLADNIGFVTAGAMLAKMNNTGLSIGYQTEPDNPTAALDIKGKTGTGLVAIRLNSNSAGTGAYVNTTDGAVWNIGFGANGSGGFSVVKDQTISVAGTELFVIDQAGGLKPYSRTIAQLAAIAPGSQGVTYFCSDCTLAGGRMVESTGTSAGNWADADGSAWE